MSARSPLIWRETELGLEKRCCMCHEFWPVDDEFFYIKKSGPDAGEPHSHCKACYLEWRLAHDPKFAASHSGYGNGRCHGDLVAAEAARSAAA